MESYQGCKRMKEKARYDQVPYDEAYSFIVCVLFIWLNGVSGSIQRDRIRINASLREILLPSRVK